MRNYSTNGGVMWRTCFFVFIGTFVLLLGCQPEEQPTASPTPWPGESPIPGETGPTPTGTPAATPLPAGTATPLPAGTATPVPTGTATPLPGTPTPVPADGDGDGFSIADGDCDDGDAGTYPGAVEYSDGVDNDCDGEVDEDLDATDDDGDGLSEWDGDCDDNDPTVYPEAMEVPYDGVDQDCSGADLTDVDGDGVDGGADGEDCDDGDPGVYPGAAEIAYDGVDQDCSGADLTDVDGDGVDGGADGADCDDEDPGRSPLLEEVPYDGVDQDCSGGDLTDVDGDGVDGGADGEDCDDEDPGRSPLLEEVPYDGVDQDCSGADLTDVDGDGFDATQAGGQDCDDQDQYTHPGADEYADGRDNDCDGSVDENLSTTDDDGDGYSEADGDCNDYDASVYEGADEVPYDGIDQDCDGQDLTDVDQDGSTGGDEGPDCDDTDPTVYPGADEVPYDGIDQDCDGEDLTDVDQDGYASTASPGGTDCDDQDPNIHPGASEIPYDGVDQDCTGADLTDVDGDGFDAVDAGGTDCNDGSEAIHPEADELCDGVDNNCDNVIDDDAVDRTTWYTDGDHDGYGDPEAPVLSCSGSESLVEDSSDCDDTSADNHPGAEESCDEVDNDCDGQVDEDVQATFFQDADGDGFGNPDLTASACAPPEGFVADATDCDDGAATIYPDAPEICNGLDEDCDGAIDEGVEVPFYQDADQDGFGNAAISVEACEAPSGYVADATDCRDTNDEVYPGAPERCNGKDDDCDGEIDEMVSSTFYFDSDGDGYGDAAVSVQDCDPPSGYVADATDCDDQDPAAHPGASEACNGVDDDCDGAVDEQVLTPYFSDLDGDGYGDPDNQVEACSAPPGYVVDGTDCDDDSNTVHPGATEFCNDIDDNCNGQVDEGVGFTYYRDADGDGFGDPDSTTLSCDLVVGYATNALDCADDDASIYPNAPESCNGLDDDCDGTVDEEVLTSWYQDADADGYGDPNVVMDACTQPSGYVDDATDCRDTNDMIHPGAVELANGLDDDCDGDVDEGVYFPNCLEIITYLPGSADGVFIIDPDGAAGPIGPFQVYCDMTTDGGGWTLIATTADDNNNTWSYDNRSLLWDSRVIGDLSRRNQDYKSVAYSTVAWSDMMFKDSALHFAVYEGIYPARNKSVADWMPRTLDCAYATGRSYTMTEGNLPPGKPDQSCKNRDQRVYFTIYDNEGGGCGNDNNAYGPTWAYMNNNTGGADDPGGFGWGPGWAGGDEMGVATLGDKCFTTSESGSGAYIQWFVR